MFCINMPDILSYPKVLEAHEVPELNERFVYYCQYYGYYGYTIIINRENNDVGVAFGDFDGNKLDPESEKSVEFSRFKEFFMGELNKLVSVMKIAHIKMLQFYFSHDGEKYRLVDVRSEANRLLSPGMMKDLFGKQVDTQVVLATAKFAKEELDKIKDRPLIIKTSSFKTIDRDDDIMPCYGIIVS